MEPMKKGKSAAAKNVREADLMQERFQTKKGFRHYKKCCRRYRRRRVADVSSLLGELEEHCGKKSAGLPSE